MPNTKTVSINPNRSKVEDLGRIKLSQIINIAAKHEARCISLHEGEVPLMVLSDPEGTDLYLSDRPLEVDDMKHILSGVAKKSIRRSLFSSDKKDLKHTYTARYERSPGFDLVLECELRKENGKITIELDFI